MDGRSVKAYPAKSPAAKIVGSSRRGFIMSEMCDVDAV
jgi:hypothetical protein